MNNGFDRRIFTAKLWIKDTLFLLKHLPTIAATMHDPAISRAFMEKVMIVVTAVNGCIYCKWFHSKAAISSGLSESELKNTLNLQFHADASNFELVALLYAQHYTETDRQPDPDMTRRLVEFYGEGTAEHIRMIIRMIYYGNLSGNTFDAFISRLRGKKAPNSSALFEAIFFILSVPVMLPILPLVNKEQH